MKANFKSILSLILIIGVVLVLSTLLEGRVNNDKFLYSDLLDLFEADLVRDFVVDDNGKITLNAYVVTKNEDGTPDRIERLFSPKYPYEYLHEHEQRAANSPDAKPPVKEKILKFFAEVK